MSEPELDWSFSDAPTGDNPPGHDAPPQATPPRATPPKAPRRPLPRWLIAALVVLAALAGLGAWLFTRLGLLRLQTQLAAQIVYEDQRARAGDVAAVLALQASGDSAWQDQQAARARLGLPAPLPAGDLLPAATPPRLVRLDPLGGDLFAATVTRDYADSSGQTYAFDLVQRYRILSPGAWERLPPDTSALAATTTFQGQRLMVSVPTADLPWLGPALLQADGLIVQACDDWRVVCPTDLRLPAAFGLAPELADPALTAGRIPRLQPSALYNTQYDVQSYPRIFDLPAGPAPYVLPAPLLAGRPHDADAQAALSRSISVALLADFAGLVSGSPRANNDYFLDALVARVEARHLGASSNPQPLAPQDYVPLKLLWQTVGRPQPGDGWRTDLAARREAFDFMNAALAGQPAFMDGRLLVALRRNGLSLSDWLDAALVPAAPALVDDWTQSTLAKFAAQPVTDWSQYNGLVMACDDGVYRVQAGAAPSFRGSLPGGSGGVSVWIDDLSRDGRYLALNVHSTQTNAASPQSAPSPWENLLVMDLSTGADAGVFAAPVVEDVGWTASDQLIYTINNSRLNSTLPERSVSLWAYDAQTAVSSVIISDTVVPDNHRPGLWSADHNTLLITLADQTSDGQWQAAQALLRFSPVVQLQRLTPSGSWPALSPDGAQVAYVASSDLTGDATHAGLWMFMVLDTINGAARSLAVSSDVMLPPGSNTFYGGVWSPNNQWLAWEVAPPNILLSAPAAGGSVRAWSGGGQNVLFLQNFSPDSRYLQAALSGQMGSEHPDVPFQLLDQYWLFDQQAASNIVQPPLTGWANAAVWSPHGHHLILAGPAGVSALDPATGLSEWLSSSQNCQLRW